MDTGGGQSSGNKRKPSSNAKIPFRVFWQDDSTGDRSLKLAKPNQPTWDRVPVLNKDYPNVCTRMVNAGNQHALNIMHNLNHKNIICMRALGKLKSEEGNEFSAVILECNGNLHQNDLWTVVKRRDGFIPSSTFQDVVMEIIDGADFLWRNETYHGNLSWSTTYFQHPYTVKLCGFTPKDLSLGEAQWQDWDGIIAMLEATVAKAVSYNALPHEIKVVYDELQALIDTMKASARVNVNPLLMRTSIFDEVFFWKTKHRAKLCMITIPSLFNNEDFAKEVENSSICPESWYCSTKTENLTPFEDLVKHCNDYRQKLQHPLPIFNGNSRMGFVRFIYAAYTHRSQIMKEKYLNVDYIIRRQCPRLFVELNAIVKRITNQEN